MLLLGFNCQQIQNHFYFSQQNQLPLHSSMSTPKFHSLSVKNIRQETADCISVSFAIDSALQDAYQYLPGQYITIKHLHEGQELRRSYSVCSAPHSGELRVAIKKVIQGVFSNYANTTLKENDVLEVMMPMGHFTPHHLQKEGNYIGFASGSGITPVMSILKSVLHANETNTFTLVYGNKNAASIIFKEEIEALKNTYLHRLQVIHILSREKLEVDLNFGRIDLQKCEQLFSKLLQAKTFDEAFICGPQEMTMTVKEFLATQGMDEKNIHFELFGTGVGIKNKSTQEEQTQDLGPISKVSIKIDQRTFMIDLPYNGASILDAALANGADLPFACKGGVCCTCRAKITKGEVKMTVNYALEKQEIADGFVLSCQAHPTTPEVVIDLDVS
jgi:ring-1,2-phenylacetyl-CoA epoxidase subunit PaaE